MTPFLIICASIFNNSYLAISQTINLIFIKETDREFDRENFFLDYFSIDWEDLLKIDELNADNSSKTFLDKINMLLGYLCTS